MAQILSGQRGRFHRMGWYLATREKESGILGGRRAKAKEWRQDILLSVWESMWSKYSHMRDGW